MSSLTSPTRCLALDNLRACVGTRDGGTPLSSFDYTLDKVGNRTQVVDGSGTTTYDYEAAYQLTGVTYPNSDDDVYTYDAMGNRLTKTHNGSTTTDYVYDAANQMLDVEGTTYDYDDAGNQIEAGSDTFEWDHENRLVATDIASVSGSYVYNGDGLRHSRTVASSTVTYTWDVAAGMPSVLQDSAGNTYVYGLDLLMRFDGTDEEWHLNDGLGSTVALADDDGDITDQYSYDVFGATRSHTGSSGAEFTFAGEQTDSSGLQYLRARYYDPENGRFLSQDPIPFLQQYAYVGNNPVNFVDPSGLTGVSFDGIGAITKEILDSACWTSPQGCSAYLDKIEAFFNKATHAVKGCLDSEGCRRTVVVIAMAVCSGASAGALTSGCVAAGSAYLAYEDGKDCVGGSYVSCGFAALDLVIVGGAARTIVGGSYLPRAFADAPRNALVGTRRSETVLGKMAAGDYHAFPDIVDNYALASRTRVVRGLDGLTYRKTTVQGWYRGVSGNFEWVVDPRKNEVTHRFFNPR